MADVRAPSTLQLKKRYIESTVMTSYPWQTETKDHLEETMEKILYLYARVAAGGDLELAKQQLRAQLREKVGPGNQD